MCLLVYCESKKITKAEFETAFKANKDGAGFAYHKDHKNFFVKGFMELEGAWKFYNSRVNVLPHVVHFRTGTAGGVHRHLTHPFIIGGGHTEHDVYHGKEDLLFHNGVLYRWEEMLYTLAINGVKVEHPYSDTMVLAVLLGRMKTNGYSYKESIALFSGKYIIMTPEKYLMVGDFTEDDGRFFSNQGYKTYSTQGYKITKGGYYFNGEYYDDDEETYWDKRSKRYKAKKKELPLLTKEQTELLEDLEKAEIARQDNIDKAFDEAMEDVKDSKIANGHESYYSEPEKIGGDI